MPLISFARFSILNCRLLESHQLRLAPLSSKLLNTLSNVKWSLFFTAKLSKSSCSFCALALFAAPPEERQQRGIIRFEFQR